MYSIYEYTVMSVYKGTVSGKYPIFLRASIDWVTISLPPTESSPLVGGINPVIIFIVVDFPAPFGPNSPTISPFSILKDILVTAGKSP